MTTELKEFSIPELGSARRGKVRDVYERDDTLVMVASDRISCFDRIMEQAIPFKGQVLTDISTYWFEKTKDIIPNHLIDQPHGNVMLVKKCQVIPVEMIVRGYITGSMWRDYSDGKREKSGIPLPDGLEKNQKLAQPIVTPTTKAEEGHDTDISKDELVAQGIVSESLWEQLETAALKLFERGSTLLAERGITLVDTKYEFGLTPDGCLTLIDEVHTPDSSRFWFQRDAEQKELKSPDKEYVRGWLLEQGFKGDGPVPSLSEEVVQEASRRYRCVYEQLLGRDFTPTEPLVTALRRAQLIQGACVLILTGSESDLPFIEKITAGLDAQNIHSQTIVASAHKVPRKVLDVLDEAEKSLEPVVFITVAGRSNALSGVVAANTKWPVIACPPHKDLTDYQVNIHSSLQMPSKTPVLTVCDPGNAALAAGRILKLAEYSA